MNRAGAAVVDAALQTNKQDVTRLVGAENIGTAWEIQENADFTCIVNPESLPDSNETFLTFKKLKRRYRSIYDGNKAKDVDYFNQPFEIDNNIKLLEDYDLDKPLGLTSLATTYVAAKDEGNRGELSSAYKEKDKKDDKKKKSVDIISTDLNFSPFDVDNAINF